VCAQSSTTIAQVVGSRYSGFSPARQIVGFGIPPTFGCTSRQASDEVRGVYVPRSSASASKYIPPEVWFRVESHILTRACVISLHAADGPGWTIVVLARPRGVSYEFTRSVRSARSLNVHHLRAHLARAVPPLETRFAGKRFANHVSYCEHCFCKIRRIVGVARNLSQPVGERTI
jgi:hypothetical protein